VLPLQAQERRVIHVLDVTIPLGRDGLPVPLRQRDPCLILIVDNRSLSKFSREKPVHSRHGFIGHRGNNDRGLNRRRDVMNEEKEDADAAHRQHDAERHGQARNKSALVAAADGAQHDQAIGENAGEDSEHDLRDAVAHEVPQDARGVLDRG
jgi:hypothetical protein